MNFFAILKDSLREAIDTKVFYVMVGLSGLLTLLAATLSFKPTAPDKIMQFMVVGLSGSMKDLNPERMIHMAQELQQRRYQILGAEPANNAPEGPDSPYTITLAVRCENTAEARKLREAPATTLDLVKDRFGNFPDFDPETGKVEEFRILNVTDTRLARPDNTFVPKPPDENSIYVEITTAPTPFTRRFWPCEPSLFFGALPLPFLKEVPLGLQLYLLLDQVVNGIGAWIAILVSVVITAFF